MPFLFFLMTEKKIFICHFVYLVSDCLVNYLLITYFILEGVLEFRVSCVCVVILRGVGFAHWPASFELVTFRATIYFSLVVACRWHAYADN